MRLWAESDSDVFEVNISVVASRAEYNHEILNLSSRLRQSSTRTSL